MARAHSLSGKRKSNTLYYSSIWIMICGSVWWNMQISFLRHAKYMALATTHFMVVHLLLFWFFFRRCRFLLSSLFASSSLSLLLFFELILECFNIAQFFFFDFNDAYHTVVSNTLSLLSEFVFFRRFGCDFWFVCLVCHTLLHTNFAHFRFRPSYGCVLSVGLRRQGKRSKNDKQIVLPVYDIFFCGRSLIL